MMLSLIRFAPTLAKLALLLVVTLLAIISLRDVFRAFIPRDQLFKTKLIKRRYEAPPQGRWNELNQRDNYTADTPHSSAYDSGAYDSGNLLIPLAVTLSTRMITITVCSPVNFLPTLVNPAASIVPALVVTPGSPDIYSIHPANGPANPHEVTGSTGLPAASSASPDSVLPLSPISTNPVAGPGNSNFSAQYNPLATPLEGSGNSNSVAQSSPAVSPLAGPETTNPAAQSGSSPAPLSGSNNAPAQSGSVAAPLVPFQSGPLGVQCQYAHSTIYPPGCQGCTKTDTVTQTLYTTAYNCATSTFTFFAALTVTVTANPSPCAPKSTTSTRPATILTPPQFLGPAGVDSSVVSLAGSSSSFAGNTANATSSAAPFAPPEASVNPTPLGSSSFSASPSAPTTQLPPSYTPLNASSTTRPTAALTQCSDGTLISFGGTCPVALNATAAGGTALGTGSSAVASFPATVTPASLTAAPSSVGLVTGKENFTSTLVSAAGGVVSSYRSVVGSGPASSISLISASAFISAASNDSNRPYTASPIASAFISALPSFTDNGILSPTLSSLVLDTTPIVTGGSETTDLPFQNFPVSGPSAGSASVTATTSIGSSEIGIVESVVSAVNSALGVVVSGGSSSTGIAESGVGLTAGSTGFGPGSVGLASSSDVVPIATGPLSTQLSAPGFFTPRFPTTVSSIDLSRTGRVTFTTGSVSRGLVYSAGSSAPVVTSGDVLASTTGSFSPLITLSVPVLGSASSRLLSGISSSAAATFAPGSFKSIPNSAPGSTPGSAVSGVPSFILASESSGQSLLSSALGSFFSSSSLDAAASNSFPTLGPSGLSPLPTDIGSSLGPSTQGSASSTVNNLIYGGGLVFTSGISAPSSTSGSASDLVGSTATPAIPLTIFSNSGSPLNLAPSLGLSIASVSASNVLPTVELSVGTFVASLLPSVTSHAGSIMSSGLLVDTASSSLLSNIVSDVNTVTRVAGTFGLSISGLITSAAPTLVESPVPSLLSHASSVLSSISTAPSSILDLVPSNLAPVTSSFVQGAIPADTTPAVTSSMVGLITSIASSATSELGFTPTIMFSGQGLIPSTLSDASSALNVVPTDISSAAGFIASVSAPTLGSSVQSLIKTIFSDAKSFTNAVPTIGASVFGLLPTDITAFIGSSVPSIVPSVLSDTSSATDLAPNVESSLFGTVTGIAVPAVGSSLPAAIPTFDSGVLSISAGATSSSGPLSSIEGSAQSFSALAPITTNPAPSITGPLASQITGNANFIASIVSDVVGDVSSVAGGVQGIISSIPKILGGLPLPIGVVRDALSGVSKECDTTTFVKGGTTHVAIVTRVTSVITVYRPSAGRIETRYE